MNHNRELVHFLNVFHKTPWAQAEDAGKFLSMCSKLETYHKGFLPKILPLLEYLDKDGQLDDTLITKILDRQQSPLNIFSMLVEHLQNTYPNDGFRILVDVVEFTPLVRSQLVYLLQLNIINPINYCHGLFYFFFGNPPENLSNFLPRLKLISAEESLGWLISTHDINVNRHFESYLANITISQQIGLRSVHQKIIASATNPFSIAELLCSAPIRDIFKNQAVLDIVSDYHLPELTILLVYLDKLDSIPISFLQDTLTILLSGKNDDLINLEKALMFLFRLRALEYFEYLPTLIQNPKNAYNLAKIYQLLLAQKQQHQFLLFFEISQTIPSRKLLNLMDDMFDHQIDFQTQLKFLQFDNHFSSLDKRYMYFLHLYKHHVSMEEVGTKLFFQLIDCQSTVLVDMLVCFKKQNLLTPAFCDQLFTPAFIEKLIQHNQFDILFDMPMNEMFNYLLFHFSPNKLHLGFDTMFILHKNLLLESDNWAKNLSVIRICPDFANHVKHLFDLDAKSKLNQISFDEFILSLTQKNLFFNAGSVSDMKNNPITLRP